MMPEYIIVGGYWDDTGTILGRNSHALELLGVKALLTMCY